MAEDYCLTWNAWRVWLHPRRALDALEDAGFMQENLEFRLNAANALLEERERESVRLSKESEELTRRLVEKEKEFEGVRRALEDTRRELGDVREMLAEQDEIDNRLREFDAALTKVENMKRRYEKRISELEAMLRDALQRSRKYPDTELIDPADPESMPVFERRPIDMSSRRGLSEDIAVPEPSGIRKGKETRAGSPRPPVRPKGTAAKSDSDNGQGPGDDWLLELPDDL